MNLVEATCQSPVLVLPPPSQMGLTPVKPHRFDQPPSTGKLLKH
jgi:hypothetical protein